MAWVVLQSDKFLVLISIILVSLTSLAAEPAYSSKRRILFWIDPTPNSISIYYMSITAYRLLS